MRALPTMPEREMYQRNQLPDVQQFRVARKAFWRAVSRARHYLERMGCRLPVPIPGGRPPPPAGVKANGAYCYRM
jgi:hypothetical protein